MTKKEVKEQLNFSYEKFIYECNRKADFVKYDIDKFSYFGFTSEKLTTYRQQIQEFNSKKFDNIYQINIRHLDQLIAELAIKIKTAMCDIRIVAFCTWDKNHDKYIQFKQFNRREDSFYDLSASFRKMIKIVNKDAEEFISSGLKAEIISKAADLQNDFDAAISARDDAIIQRDIAAHNKLIEADKLNNVLNFICELGKQIWQNTDETRYKDYLIPLKKNAAQNVTKPKTDNLEVAA